ncbi:MAG: hypothetical protein KVP17_004232 [Porospora cf. gigantea B]|uniref:uncharacterized protein n=1 Tax=Porospora cf. gigantea B TaxID=2853592 RepID=UPI00357181EE|nr:MAG: hypothetical protein KVP17_004232 [Porospora cf. gigantea B]
MKRRLEERLLTASIELMLVSVALCLLQRRYMPMGELSDGLRVLAILAATYMHWLSASMTQMSSYYNVSCLWGFLLASNLFVGYHTSWNALTTAINALSFFLLFILSPQNLARRFGLFASFVFLLALPFIVVSFVETSRDRSRSGLEEKLTVSDAFGDSGYFKNDTRLYLLRHDPRSEQIKYALGSGLADILRNTGRILECEFKAHKLRSLATVRVETYTCPDSMSAKERSQFLVTALSQPLPRITMKGVVQPAPLLPL